MPAYTFSRFDEPVHIVLGDGTAGTLRSCKIIVLRDNLACGPSALDPVRHGEQRRAFWRNWVLEGPWSVSPRVKKRRLDSLAAELFSAQQLATAIQAYPDNKPLLLWTAPLWRERLSFWWTLDAICQAGIHRERLWIAQPKLIHPAQTSLGCFCREELNEAF